MKLKKYCTGLVWLACANEKTCQRSPAGRGWRVSFQKPRPTTHSDPSPHQKEVIIHAASRESAQRVLNLIINCIQLIFGDPHVFSMNLVAFNLRELNALPEEEKLLIAGTMHSNTIVGDACDLAAKLCQRRRTIYALAKYSFSMNCFSVSNMDLQEDTPHFNISGYQDDHVRFVHCIISAYSAIEELGLEVRASNQRPSILNGKWNPIVLADIEARLTSAGIDLSDTFPWLLRVTRRKIEMKKSLPITKRAPWAYGRVRDHEVKITDAIAYASWLRSGVSSHTIKETTRRLTAYDVANVQHLARRLILESHGEWK